MTTFKKVGTTLLFALLNILLFAPAAFAETAVQDNEFSMKKFAALAAGLGIGIAAFGGALAQGRAAAATLEGIARNPGADRKLLLPMILGLALIESLVIYALLISFNLVGKLG